MFHKEKRFLAGLSMALALVAGGGCATIPGTGVAEDPLEPMNRAVYSFNRSVDDAVLKPVAQAYRSVVPSPVRQAVRNVFSNLNDVTVALNNPKF